MQTLAIAYLVGQADDREVGKFRRLYATNAEFRALVTELEQWLAPLDQRSGQRTPPPELLDEIMEDIRRDAAEHSVAVEPARHGVNRAWRSAALAAFALAVVAGGSHLVGPWAGSGAQPRDNEQLPLVATLTDDQAPELIAIVYDPARQRIVARLTNIDVPSTQSLQLWLIRDGDAGPRSLGVLDPIEGDTDRVPLDLEERLRSGTDVLAVSLEARGGTREGAPQGPVLFSGSVVDLAEPANRP